MELIGPLYCEEEAALQGDGNRAAGSFVPIVDLVMLYSKHRFPQAPLSRAQLFQLAGFVATKAGSNRVADVASEEGLRWLIDVLSAPFPEEEEEEEEE